MRDRVFVSNVEQIGGGNCRWVGYTEDMVLWRAYDIVVLAGFTTDVCNVYKQRYKTYTILTRIRQDASEVFCEDYLDCFNAAKLICNESDRSDKAYIVFELFHTALHHSTMPYKSDYSIESIADFMREGLGMPATTNSLHRYLRDHEYYKVEKMKGRSVTDKGEQELDLALGNVIIDMGKDTVLIRKQLTISRMVYAEMLILSYWDDTALWRSAS